MKIEMSVLENIKCCFEEKGTTNPWSSYLASTWKFKTPATPDWLVESLEATVRAVYVHALCTLYATSCFAFEIKEKDQFRIYFVLI